MSELKKHEAAYILYEKGISQKAIAGILNISEKTVGNWKVKYEWSERAVTYTVQKRTSEDNTLEALAHQTRVINLISKRLAETIDEDSDIDTLKKALIPKGEIDAVQKLFTTIKRKELEWGDMVRILREFSTYVKDKNLELAQDLVTYVDGFINEARR